MGDTPRGGDTCPEGVGTKAREVSPSVTLCGHPPVCVCDVYTYIYIYKRAKAREVTPSVTLAVTPL